MLEGQGLGSRDRPLVMGGLQWMIGNMVSGPLRSPYPVFYKRVPCPPVCPLQPCLSFFQASPAPSSSPGPLASSTMRTNSELDRPAMGQGQGCPDGAAVGSAKP